MESIIYIVDINKLRHFYIPSSKVTAEHHNLLILASDPVRDTSIRQKMNELLESWRNYIRNGPQSVNITQTYCISIKLPQKCINLSGPKLIEVMDSRFARLGPNSMYSFESLTQRIEKRPMFKKYEYSLLNLSDNLITDSEIKSIVDFCLSLPNLKELNLSGNSLDGNDECIQELAKLLQKPGFEYLNIVSCGYISGIDSMHEFAKIIYNPSHSYFSEFNDDNNYLFKIIWLPETWLDEKETKRRVPYTHLKIHKIYYLNKKL